jgi:hypothetical protein
VRREVQRPLAPLVPPAGFANLRTSRRRRVLFPLSYGGDVAQPKRSAPRPLRTDRSSYSHWGTKWPGVGRGSRVRRLLGLEAALRIPALARAAVHQVISGQVQPGDPVVQLAGERPRVPRRRAARRSRSASPKWPNAASSTTPTLVPSTLTEWRAWKRSHPRTLALDAEDRLTRRLAPDATRVVIPPGHRAFM